MGKKGFGFDHLVSQAAKQKEAAEIQEKTSVSHAKKNITVYEEFKFLVPPLTADEFHKLEVSILAEGCRDPLVLWHKQGGEEDEWVLIDGHNRYQICLKNALEFNVLSLEFPDYESVVHWIINNQLGKRNATEETKSYLRGLQYHREKRKETNWHNLRQFAGEGEQPASGGSTAERLGELHKVSEKTIKRDEKFAIAIDKICAQNHALKTDILQRNINVPKLKLIELSDEPAERLAELGALLAGGLSFMQAYTQTFAQEEEEEKDTHTQHKEKTLKTIKHNIISSLDTVLKTGDKSHIAALRKYLEDLENTL